jgi:hypothetical protein
MPFAHGRTPAEEDCQIMTKKPLFDSQVNTKAKNIPTFHSDISKKPIWNWRHAIEETDIKAATKALALVIANDLTDTGKFSQMPIEDLARRAGMNVRSAETHLGKLRKARLLEVSVRRDALGHPIGRRFSPMFPASFRLPTEDEAAQTANLALREETQTANFDSQTAKNDSQTANFAVTYNETSSQTFPKTLNAQQAAQIADEVSLPSEPTLKNTATSKRKPATKGSAEFEAAWEAYRKRSKRSPGSKPKALGLYSRLTPEKQALVLPAIEAYGKDCEGQRFGRGEHRNMADMDRFFTNFFEQFSEQAAPVAVQVDLKAAQAPNRVRCSRS